MRKYTIPQNLTVEYLLGDHLGSTSITTDSNGAKVSEIRYKPWGEVRYTWTASLTATPAYKLPQYTFTGQFSYMDDPSTAGVAEGFGLLFYNARWYDPVNGRFAQADTLVPGGVQGWDRYAYASNNPVRYSDPTGHDVDCGIGDSYCNDTRREYYYAWHSQLGGSFKTFLRAKDACAFYYKHPDVALKDMFAESQGGSWEEEDAYTLADFYSEYVKHQYFNPVSDQSLLWEIDRLNAIKESGGYVDPQYYWTLVFSAVVVFGPSESGGEERGIAPEDILMPGGNPIGMQQGMNPQYRTIQTEHELKKIFNALVVDGIPYTPSTYKGIGYQLPNGGWVGLRQSTDFGLTMDVNIPGIPIKKIHLPIR